MNTFVFHNFLTILVGGFLCAGVTVASPLLSSRDANSDSPNSHMSPRTIELMIIAILLFVSVFLAFYIYRRCQPRPREPMPMYNIPRSTLIHPTMGNRPLRRTCSITSSTYPLVRASVSSETIVVQEEIVRPADARTRTRFSGRAVGVSPI